MMIPKQDNSINKKGQFGKEEKLNLCRLLFDFKKQYEILTTKQKEYAGKKNIEVPYGKNIFKISELYFENNKLYAHGRIISSSFSRLISSGDFPIKDLKSYEYLKSCIEDKIDMIDGIKNRIN